ncbi:MAG TPA: isoleucine--tRNA ligase [Puia sp.]|nr:isoleucine--tRNA ligase [Puia sp.]
MSSKSTKYKEYQQLSLPHIGQEILNKWNSENTFQKSVDLREGSKTFVFYEGPPSANGMPGIHHVISRTLKDLVCRYKTMQGFQVKRKGGWDTHGLPVELGVEKELGITKEDIGKKISVEEYNRKCREAVLRYKDKWDELTSKMGYWVDLKNPYITFDNNYIETLWWILKQLYDKELLYEDLSIQPYSPAAGTGLSSHELNQPGTYKEVKDTSCVAMFKVADKSQLPFDSKWDVFFLAWTTTPWTLPSNLALTVGANITYCAVDVLSPYHPGENPITVILAKDLVENYISYTIAEESVNPFPFGKEILDMTEEQRAEGIKKNRGKTFAVGGKTPQAFKGRDLEGISYEQLLPYPANKINNPNSFKVLLGDFVTTEDGTGIVHTAPAFGADDFRVGKKFDIGILIMVDKQGKFIDGMGEFSNRYVKNYKDDPNYVDVNVDICVKLKKENRAFKIEKYEHSYPHCWRTDKPILYYPLDAWFIKTTALKGRMVELNKTITWKPRSTGEGRFGNWLENMVDWNLSRSRFWGTALPIWRSADGSEEICIGSIEELNAGIRKANEVLGGDVNKHYLHQGILDLHKPFVDEIILSGKSGKPLQRVPDLIDVWFDSGAMPYAQWHFPFENIEAFSQNYPADFIAEGVDQTRGWFYTLHAIGSLIKESVQEVLAGAGLYAGNDKYPGLAFKTVVSNGLVLDKNGNKMSKRVGNVVDPFKTIEQFGADATRWYLITNASPWESMKFDIDGIKEVQRKFFGTLYNTYQFFALYANVDGFSFSEKYIPVADRPEIDQWILSSLNTLIKRVTENFDDYEPTIAGRLIEDFVDEHLSNWYVRLSRRRFWKGEYEHDKISAYQTLYECLETVSLLMAPISPFFSDWLFTNLNEVSGRVQTLSVHFVNFPKAMEGAIDGSLEERMQLAQDTSSLILSLRKKSNIKVRQPLQKVLIPVVNSSMKDQLASVEDLIKSEVNVKEIQYLEDTEGFIKKKIKPNFVALGKKLGTRMRAVSAALAAFTQEDISKLEKEGSYSLLIDSETLILQINDVEIISEDVPGWIVANKNLLTVALDITITPELANEGNARELVNRIQKIRKDNGYELTDRISVKIADGSALKQSITQFNNYICAEILADAIELVPEIANGTEIEVNDVPLKVFVTKKD